MCFDSKFISKQARLPEEEVRGKKERESESEQKKTHFPNLLSYFPIFTHEDILRNSMSLSLVIATFEMNVVSDGGGCRKGKIGGREESEMEMERKAKLSVVNLFSPQIFLSPM